MAGIRVSSTLLSFLLLLPIAFSFSAQLTPLTADLKIRKLGVMPSPPPSPVRNPPRHTRPPRHHPPPPPPHHHHHHHHHPHPPPPHLNPHPPAI